MQTQGGGRLPCAGALGPHQQHSRQRPLRGSGSPGPRHASTAGAPRWRPPNPRPRGPQSPWCLQQQPAGMVSGPRPRPLRQWGGSGGREAWLPSPAHSGSGEGREGGRRGSIAPPLPHSCSSSPPRHCCWKSHSCSGGTHRSSQKRCPGSQKFRGCRLNGWGQGPGGGPDPSVGAELGSGGQGSASAEEGRCSAGSPRAGLQWSDRMRSSRPTTPPGPVCAARRICGPPALLCHARGLLLRALSPPPPPPGKEGVLVSPPAPPPALQEGPWKATPPGPGLHTGTPWAPFSAL